MCKKYIPNQANNFIQLLRSSRNQLKTKFNMQLNVNKMYKQYSIFNKYTHHSNFYLFFQTTGTRMKANKPLLHAFLLLRFQQGGNIECLQFLGKR